jgi:hypothetical protein
MVDGNRILGGLGRRLTKLQSGTLTIKGYFKFERVISL